MVPDAMAVPIHSPPENEENEHITVATWTPDFEDVMPYIYHQLEKHRLGTAFSSESQLWYNELPPVVYRFIKDTPDRLVPALLHKWDKEIQWESLDSLQRQVLRAERMARVYYNTVSCPVKDASRNAFQAKGDEARYRKMLAMHEKKLISQTTERRLKRMFCAYGMQYHRAHAPRSTRFCDRVNSVPPYSGPYAYRMYPSESSSAKSKRKHFQVMNKSMAAHRLPTRTRSLMRKHPTTAHALWRQHRFLSADGWEFKAMKEQLRATRYKAMQSVLNTDGSNLSPVALETTRLWSNYLPDDIVMSDVGDSGSEERQESSETVEPIDSDHSSNKKNKDILDNLESADRQTTGMSEQPLFTVDEEYLEDLIHATDQLRGTIAPHVIPQPKGNFYPDPRQHPKYLMECAGRFHKRYKGPKKHTPPFPASTSLLVTLTQDDSQTREKLTTSAPTSSSVPSEQQDGKYGDDGGDFTTDYGDTKSLE